MATRTIIGVDLGGTKIALARYNATTWEIEEEERLPTHADQTLDHVVDDMVDAILKLRSDNTQLVGIGVPGLVTQPQGIIVTMPNIPGSQNVPLKENLENKLNLPVFIDNDANCFALAEALLGFGKDQQIVVGVTMGTGVGGGIVIDGTILHGAHGYAGEIGHMLLSPGNPPFKTEDKRGDVEQFLSGSAFRKRCEVAKRPEEYLEGNICTLMHEDVFREVAWLCVNLTHLIDPDVIIFGGSAGKALAPYLKDIEKELVRWLLPETPPPELAISKLENAATLGAALLGIKDKI